MKTTIITGLLCGACCLQTAGESNTAREKLIERFLKYVTYDTQSSETSANHPSTSGQSVFARLLADELALLGAKDIHISDGAFVYATIPASADRTCEKPLGFFAHLDTSPDVSGANVKPSRVTYTGGELPLGTSGRKLDPAVYTELESLVGKELIVTDGTTLLGADNKLGVAILMTLAETLLAADAPSHREIRLCFTPDEELGVDMTGFEPDLFGAKVAYTVDGNGPDEIMNENFNAASAQLEFRGVSAHAGSAKGIMVNALKLATAFVQRLPSDESPECTSGREGFFHPISISGSVGEASLSILIRDHDERSFEARKQLIEERTAEVNERLGAGTAKLTIKDEYQNMAKGLASFPELVTSAQAAIAAEGVQPRLLAARGGTVGATLTAMGIPCPNLGTGGHNSHCEYEYAVVDEVAAMLRIVTRLSVTNSIITQDKWILPQSVAGDTANERCYTALKAQGFGEDVSGALADTNLYASFRTWAESKGLDPDDLTTKHGVILAAAYDANGVAEPSNVVMAIDELAVETGTNGTMAFTLNVEANGYDPAKINTDLLKASLGVCGSADLATVPFSSNALCFEFGELREGKLPVLVKPREIVAGVTPTKFFIRAAAK